MRLEPMVDWIGEVPIRHGERDNMDPEHPKACLCGEPDYLCCPDFGQGIQALTIGPAQARP